MGQITDMQIRLWREANGIEPLFPELWRELQKAAFDGGDVVGATLGDLDGIISQLRKAYAWKQNGEAA